jgi:hypothetical protein
LPSTNDSTLNEAVECIVATTVWDELHPEGGRRGQVHKTFTGRSALCGRKVQEMRPLGTLAQSLWLARILPLGKCESCALKAGDLAR